MTMRRRRESENLSKVVRALGHSRYAFEVRGEERVECTACGCRGTQWTLVVCSLRGVNRTWVCFGWSREYHLIVLNLEYFHGPLKHQMDAPASNPLETRRLCH